MNAILKTALEMMQVLETMPEDVILFDADFPPQSMNNTFTALSDLPREKAIGNVPGDSGRTQAFSIKCSAKGVEQLRCKGGRYCSCGRNAPGIITPRAYRAADGVMAGLIKIINDMTRLYESRQRFRRGGGVIKAMSLTIKKRDPYTASHQRRVAELCRAIAGELAFSWERKQGLCMAATIHDMGKILVPAGILHKPGAMSEQELVIIRDHPRTAYEILKEIDFPWPLAETIYQHHERMDGSGYPRGIKGSSILVEARILAVADVVDAISCFRTYRPGKGLQAALSELNTQRGKLYDAVVVDACLRVLSKGKVENPGLLEQKRFRAATSS